MSVKETDIIDAMGIDESTNTLSLLITDPYPWLIQEYDHLKTMQEKINHYVAYLENKGYTKEYGSRTFDHFHIEAALKYAPTDAGKSFFEAGRQQLKQRGIRFAYTVIPRKEG
ncbi:MAG: DUF6572 domain-containing protein [Acutalibacteraceae bacterium]|nr:DUF6572 domain-containing protein [Acutalibacteraceae bacterium]